MCACKVTSVVSDSVTLWIIARQAPLSMGFFRQEYWSRLPFPPPGNLPNSGIEPLLCFLHWQVDSLPLVPPGHTFPVAYFHHLFIQMVTDSLNEVFISPHQFSYTFTAPVCISKWCVALFCRLLNYTEFYHSACAFLQGVLFIQHPTGEYPRSSSFCCCIVLHGVAIL